jgi:hypothetical protein
MRKRVVSGHRITDGQRYSVHPDTARLRLLDVLEQDFPALRRLLGEQRFRDMGGAYIENHPAPHFPIRRFGRYLAGFLASHPRFQDQPVLADLAAFEWTLGESLDAAQDTRLHKADMVQHAFEHWPKLHLRLHPSVRFVTLLWDTPAIRQAHDRLESLPTPQAYEKPVTWVVWRKNLFSHYRSLPPPEACALGALAEGHDFGLLCEKLCRWLEEQQAASEIATMLAQWLSDGLLAEVHSG